MAISVGDATLKITGETKDLDQALEGMQAKIKSSAAKMQQALRPVGIAFTGVGAAGLKLVGDAKKLNAQIGVTAKSLGITTGELRDLVIATSNVTFPLEEVTATFDLLTRAGMDNKDEMAKTATAFDTLGDAIGLSASDVTNIMIPALKTYGIDLKDAGDHVDTFTWLVRNTTVDLEDFGAALTYLAPDMEDLGISIDDTVVLLAALEDKGVSGATATRELRKAVTKAVKEQKPLNEVLGISVDKLADYSVELENATGITQEYADEANKQYGLMDKLKHSWKELAFKVGSIIEPLEGVFGAMTALGPAMILLSTGMGKAAFFTIAHTTSLVAHRIAAWLAFAATAALAGAVTGLGFVLGVLLGPVGIAVLAIGGLAGAGVLLWKNWETVKKKCLEIFNSIKDYLVDTWDRITSDIVGAWNNIQGFFLGILRTIKGLFTDTWATIQSTTKTAFEGIARFMLWPINKAVNAITDALNIAVDALNVLVSGANLIPGVDIPKIPKIPHWEMPALEFAEGGIVRKRTLAMLGEAGPEAVMPLSRLVNIAQAASPPGEVSSQTINLNLNVANLTVREEEDISRIGEALVDEIRARTGVKI